MSKIDVRLLGMINELQNTGVDTTARAAIAEHATQLAQIGVCEATNLVNGTFENTDHWEFNGGTGSVSGNVMTFTANAPNGYVAQRVPQIIQGHTYYVGEYVQADGPIVLVVGDNTNFSTYVSLHTGSGNYEYLHGIVDITTPVSTANAYFGIRDTRTSGFTAIHRLRPMCLDLTATFGAGREPTLAQMEAYVAAYWPNGWFDSTVNLAQADKMVPFLFSEIRSLRAAVVALGGTL